MINVVTMIRIPDRLNQKLFLFHNMLTWSKCTLPILTTFEVEHYVIHNLMSSYLKRHSSEFDWSVFGTIFATLLLSEFQIYINYALTVIPTFHTIKISSFFNSIILEVFTIRSTPQLGGLVVKSLTCSAGGLGFKPPGSEPKIIQEPSSAKSQLDVVRMRHQIGGPL